ncbi:hypothetical protein NicSoilC5_15790 [Arthrobacter sp. NicSoilC5]|nr:hypothetical protein NicSoilC5_15790 [Arthrobacter sp. NicSoilC5]
MAWVVSAGAGVDIEHPASALPVSTAMAAMAAAVNVLFTMSLRPSRLRTWCPPAKRVPLQSLAVHPTQAAAVVHNTMDGYLSPAVPCCKARRQDAAQECTWRSRRLNSWVTRLTIALVA